MIYFDNAATSFPKPRSVIKEVNKCITSYCGNPGRSSHFLALKASEKIYETREQISSLLNTDKPERVVFTQNATHGLNIAIKGLITERSHVIISDIEHNSVIRPLNKVMGRLGGEISVFNSDIDIREAVIPLIRSDTKAIISTLSSNVTGKCIDFITLSRIAHEYGLKLIIDASQYIGHSRIDLKTAPCDCLIAPGHKALFGLQGSGFIVFGEGDSINTLIEGGSGSDTLSTDMPLLLPERHEAGTLATPSIVGLSMGVRFIEELGINYISTHLKKLTEYTYIILNEFKDIKVYGAENGIISFNYKDIPSSAFAEKLNEYGFAVRGGLHCAPEVHRKLGTAKRGAVRISLSCLNNSKQLDKLYKSLKEITK